MGGRTRTYRDVQRLSWSIARALSRSGVRPGDKVAVLSANDPVAFSCVVGIARAGAVWCPVNPRNEATENRELLDAFDCSCLIFQAAFAPLVAQIAADLPKLATLVCLDQDSAGSDPATPPIASSDPATPPIAGSDPATPPIAGPDPATPPIPGAISFSNWLNGDPGEPWQAGPAGDVAIIAGTGGTTGKPKGVMLTGHSIETMTALTLMSYPFDGRPVYLALAPLTHAAGVFCFPIMALGAEIVILPAPDPTEFLSPSGRHRVTHAFLPPTLTYLLLDHPGLPGADLTSLQCLWYGAAPMSAARLEQAIGAIGPVMGQLFGQTEAPMMRSEEHT